MRQNTYRVLLNKEPEGGFTALVPMLPGCITYGETMDEAIVNVKEAIELYMESLTAHGEPIKETFFSILKQAGINKSEL